MALTDEIARPLAKSGALRFVFWISLLYLVLSAIQLFDAVNQLLRDLGSRASGITWTWSTDYPVPQPTGNTFSGAAFIVPGSTAHFTEMTATVAGIPVGTIVMHGLADIVAILTGAGIAVCLVVLTNRMAAGVPFARASYVALLWLAGVVFAGFEAADALRGIADFAFTTVLAGAPADQDGLWNTNEGVTVFIGWPLYVAAALLALAAVFRVGAAYRQDSEGLV
ncbi:hypothetical protein [Gryllotalpicola protaetiae]|uniref:DUF2975 domain-containing protein n=1 Tax=Gryllotalpicola protaetiae TaxID=2419771 RepID=A0A387BTT5_9MICO|nr:hypothetical protein [Gryllotalpicola protaetiae]AYG04480.1 hypothetical protein D7I44_13705 [Gryllotalpicola protaetiae]